MKKPKKTFTFCIKDKESGKVLYSWETTFTDQNGRGFDSPVFAYSLLSHGDDQLKELVEIEFKEKK